MPAQAAVPLTIQISLTHTDGGDANIQNSWYMTYGQSASSADLNTLMGIVVSSWSANIAPHVAAILHLTGVTITDLNSKTGAKVGESVSVAGTGPGAALTSGVAAVVSGKEAMRYRGGHRRVYIGGQSESNLFDPNTFTSAYQSALSAGVSAFVNQIISAAPAGLGALKDVVVHRFGDTAGGPVVATSGRTRLRSVPLTNPFTMPISSYATNPQVASQRRRNQQGH